MSKPSRMEILELLSNGKITAAEAADLLSDVGEPAKAAAPPPPPPAEKAPAPEPVVATKGDDSQEPNWFRVRVANLETGKNRVTVNIPVKMMKFGLKIGSRFSPEIDNLDWNELTGMMKDMKTGMLVDVQDADSNEHVQVYLD
ncbi:SHOCT-like domain-containing protein [Candidatus Leptofilum sp.]|uniref:SHOCT-like domain-containing protein n=1 Tax=Candidatus Leptofilum sp. TaxID=3241576 RepID=UPI003B5C2CBB